MAQATEPGPKMLDTGVPNLDLVLGGGLQPHNSYMIVGPSGSGKSVLSQQIAFHRAKQGERALLITGLDEPHHNLLEHLRALSFVDFSMVGPQVETVSMVPFLEQPLQEKMNVLRRTVLNARPRLVTFDGLRSFEAFVGGEHGVYEFIYGLTSWFAVEGITLLVTKQVDAGAAVDSPEFGLVDGVLLLQRQLAEGRSVRRLWALKMRGQQPLDGPHSYDIGANGVTVWPRPQATFKLEDRSWGDARLAFGVPTLDSRLGGGLPVATSTLLAGDPGTGKTTLALAFLSNGVHEGQPGLWLGFRESRARLLAASQRWSGDLSAAEAGGKVRFVIMPPFELEPDRLAALIQTQVAELGAKRLALDGAEVLERWFPYPRDAERFLAWLLRFLPQQGVTTVITQQVPKAAGQAFDASTVPNALLAENVILIRQLQEASHLRQAIAIAKMSSPGYDPTIRDFSMDQYGVNVGEPLLSEVAQPALQGQQ